MEQRAFKSSQEGCVRFAYGNTEWWTFQITGTTLTDVGEEIWPKSTVY